MTVGSPLGVLSHKFSSKRRKESGTYLATDSRQCWRVQMTMKNDEGRSAGWKLHFIYHFSSSVLSSDVYGQYPGRCRSLSFFLTHFLSFHLSRFSFYINKKNLCVRTGEIDTAKSEFTVIHVDRCPSTHLTRSLNVKTIILFNTV